MSEKRSEFSEMSDVCLAADLIRQIEPRDHRSIKEWIGATARRLGWSYGRAKSVWYGEARRIDAAEMDALRKASEARQLRKLADEHRNVKERIARLQAALAVIREEIPGAKISIPEQQASGLGGMDLPRNGG